MEQPAYLFASNFVDRFLCSVFGIIVSFYALHVEVSKEKDPNYRAACDLSRNMSCSRVLTSKYGRGFGVVSLLLGKEHFMNIRNCNLGILFYSLQIILSFLPGNLPTLLLFYSSVIANLGSVYLAFILFVVLKDVCLVCITTYIINAGLLYINYTAYNM